MIGNVVMRFDEFDKTFDKSTNIVFNDIDSIVFYIFKAIFASMILIYEMSYINGV